MSCYQPHNSVDIRLCGDEAIREINAAYRGIDRATDVLSFPLTAYPTGLTAGQAQGVEIMASHGTLIEMAAVQLVINLRYALMAISLSQNLSDTFTLRHRIIASYGITDEIFALCSTRKTPVTPHYMYGIIVVSSFGSKRKAFC